MRALLLLMYAGAGALLAAVHAWGAFRREQPWTETAEIALYIAVTAASGWLWWGVR